MVFQLLLYIGYRNTPRYYFAWHNMRLGLLEKTGMDAELTFFFFGEAMSIFLLVTIIFDFLLIYGKAYVGGYVQKNANSLQVNIEWKRRSNRGNQIDFSNPH